MVADVIDMKKKIFLKAIQELGVQPVLAEIRDRMAVITGEKSIPLLEAQGIRNDLLARGCIQLHSLRHTLTERGRHVAT